jgi:WhiB family transcriptional regulator, redox-sensing transcriptional regulator
MAMLQSPRAWDENAVWRRRAACRDSRTDLFFPVGVTGPAIPHIAAAKAVCRQCPVSAECLEFAITTNQEFGVWGGTSEEERRVLRRKWRAAKRTGERAS